MTMGLLAVAAAAILYGIMPVFTKGILLTGMSSDLIVFYRVFFACIFAGIFMIVRRISFQITKRQFFGIAIFGIGGFGMTSLLLYCSYNYMSVGTATMLHFSYPIVVMLVMAILFKEEWSRFKTLSLISAVLGLLFLMEKSSKVGGIGILLALLSGFTYGIYVIATKKCDFGELPGLTIIFYVCLLNSILFAGVNSVKKTFYVPKETSVWLNLASIALLCTVVALCLLTYGIKVLGATQSAVINMLEPITSIVAGMMIFGETITGRAVCGCMFVLLAILFISLSPQKKKEKRHDKQNIVHRLPIQG